MYAFDDDELGDLQPVSARSGGDRSNGTTPRERDDRFYTPRLSARTSSASDEWVTPRGTNASPRTQVSEEEYGTPRQAGGMYGHTPRQHERDLSPRQIQQQQQHQQIYQQQTYHQQQIHQPYHHHQQQQQQQQQQQYASYPQYQQEQQSYYQQQPQQLQQQHASYYPQQEAYYQQQQHPQYEHQHNSHQAYTYQGGRGGVAAGGRGDGGGGGGGGGGGARGSRGRGEGKEREDDHWGGKVGGVMDEEANNEEALAASGMTEDDVEDVFSASRHGRLDDIEYLLNKGMPVDVRDEWGNTLLTIACQNGNKRVAKLVLRRGANINARNHKGNTPLHYCYHYGYGDTLGEYLVSKGADANSRNNAGRPTRDGI